MADQYRAHELFSWATVIGMAIIIAVKMCAQRWNGDSNVVANNTLEWPVVLVLSGMRTLMMLYWRYLGLGSTQRHVCVLLFFVWIVPGSSLHARDLVTDGAVFQVTPQPPEPL